MSMLPASAGQGPICILVCALGGEGGGVLAEWLYSVAVRAGHAAQSTSIPGVAQRTGATTYYIEIQRTLADPTHTRTPVFSLNPVPGAIDLLVSSELLETARQVATGMADASRTHIISSSARALTVMEKVNQGDGRLDDAGLLALLQRHAHTIDVLDLTALARDSGTAISAVMLGAIAACGVLPMAREHYEATIRAGGRGVQASLRGFALAYKALGTRQAQRRALDAAVQAALAPPPEPDLRALARQRLREYQDEAYVGLYDQRMARVEAAEREAPRPQSGAACVSTPAPTPAPSPALASVQPQRSGPIAAEATRWLALWMAFDDIVRVAALKVASSRMKRVRAEVGATDDEVVKLFDHFKPGVAEFASLLPTGLAARTHAWDRRRVARGREPWAWPLQLGTHTVAGVLALRALAGLKRFRRLGSRYAEEQALIERWLAALQRGSREHADLGLEIARCGRLIKGYGATHQRGRDNLVHIIDHLAFAKGDAPTRAATVHAAREAALADDAGLAFDKLLQAQGAPKRAPREQVLRFYKRRPA